MIRWYCCVSKRKIFRSPLFLPGTKVPFLFHFFHLFRCFFGCFSLSLVALHYKNKLYISLGPMVIGCETPQQTQTPVTTLYSKRIVRRETTKNRRRDEKTKRNAKPLAKNVQRRLTVNVFRMRRQWLENPKRPRIAVLLLLLCATETVWWQERDAM